MQCINAFGICWVFGLLIWASMNSATLNILVHLSGEYMYAYLLDTHLQVELELLGIHLYVQL